MLEQTNNEKQNCSIYGYQAKSLSKLAEKWLIEEILKDHPDWIMEDGVCIKCIDNYYGLLDDLEVLN